MSLIRIYRHPGQDAQEVRDLLCGVSSNVELVETEFCFNVGLNNSLSAEDEAKLLWILSGPCSPTRMSTAASGLHLTVPSQLLLEVGPRLAFTTAWSTNCVSICHACGISSVLRVERSRRFLISSSSTIREEDKQSIVDLLHDRMTECEYTEPLSSWSTKHTPEPTTIVPILERGKSALIDIGEKYGLGFDARDLDYYTSLFQDVLKRNPTDMECFDLGQSNSEHSRHWIFGGNIYIDGVLQRHSMFDLVKSTLPPISNSIIAFHDNSSSIRGFDVNTLQPTDPSSSSSFCLNQIKLHPILTAETHNFPT